MIYQNVNCFCFLLLNFFSEISYSKESVMPNQGGFDIPFLLLKTLKRMLMATHDGFAEMKCPYLRRSSHDKVQVFEKENS